MRSRVRWVAAIAVVVACGGDDDGAGGGSPDAAGGAIDASDPSIDAAAPAPDLVVVGDRTDESIEIVEQSFEADDCALAESCVGAPGTRTLLRFDAAVANDGTATFDLGEPSL